jgi:hypothetical protein
MTNPNATHITLIADRTGSMRSILSDAEGAINAFLDDQRKLPDQCSLLLVDFDDQDPFRTVYDGQIQDSVEYKLVPRGNTPLRDAVGKGIVVTGERLAALSEDERPGKVIFVVQTDGFENASREYTQEQVNAMINEQTDKWGWTFVFMASGPAAWGASQAYAGTQMGQNVHRSSGSAKGMTVSTAHLSDTIGAVRGGDVAVAAAFAGPVDIDDDGTVTETPDPKVKTRTLP